MRTDDFDYPLPAEQIAQRPAPRGTSRLLVLDAPPGDRAARHRTVAELPSLLRPGDLLVVNDTRVVPARLLGRRLPGGGGAEALLLESLDPGGRRWRAMLRPAKRLRPGTVLELGGPDGGAGDRLRATVETREERGRGVLAFERDPRPELGRVGRVPLPPYIERPPAGPDAADRDDYQTVYARVPGAVAAPTAGLHFTEALLEALEARGIARAAVTLHVGPGTFVPVTAESVDDHRMEGERFEVPAATAEAIAETRRRGGRVVAVGTTVVRTLESAALLPPGERAGVTELFIRPGFRFRAVDVLLTNFHLPRSTLLMLVSAFAGRERVLAAYREAVREGYRFYSYGDAMLLERRRAEPAAAQNST